VLDKQKGYHMLPTTPDPTETTPTRTPGSYAVIESVADRIVSLVRSLPETTVAGHHPADLAGLLRRIEDAAAEVRRGLLSSVVPDDPRDPWPTGVAYETYDGGSVDRKYDDGGILDLVGGDEVSGLIAARDAGLIRLAWSWTALGDYCRAKGLPLIVRRAGQDPEGDRRTPHVVETWKGRPSVRPIPPPKVS